MNLSTEQLHTLRHMLGINTPDDRIPKPYRNYAAVNPGDPHYIELERVGAIRCYRRAGDNTDYDWYTCTDVGRLAAIQSHKTIRYSKAKRRYSKFLCLSDVFPDLTFRQFITAPDFAQARNEA